MADEAAGETPKPRATGEAAWKAERDATDQRNAAVKRKAQEEKGARAVEAVERERRMAVTEAAQLRALNKEISARRPH